MIVTTCGALMTPIGSFPRVYPRGGTKARLATPVPVSSMTKGPAFVDKLEVVERGLRRLA